ncbi:MAG: response regulator [Gloeomargarita sp. SKYBB_i_bin120]|nr:response regulator [Gloeomargarita sp. SKYG98]MCS7292043.1 response regulator [Gloeomargarita sp. SKYB120]MDW8177603.1 response regulator [Gloeomargarita sp. SKYBB_i_bin120]
MSSITPDVRRELAALHQHQVTGTLLVESSPQQWWLYFFMGRLLYATGGSHRVRRWYRAVETHCPQFQPDWSALEATEPWEYWALVQGTTQGRLTPNQAKAVILSSVLEVLFAVLAADTVNIQLQMGQSLDRQIALLQVEQVLHEAVQLYDQWQSVGIRQLSNGAQLSPDWTPVARRNHKIPGQEWLMLLSGQYTLWDVMNLTRKSLKATVGPIVQWVQQGWVELQMLPDLPGPVIGQSVPAAPFTAVETEVQQPVIACLDASPVMLKYLESILTQAGYQVIPIPEPMLQITTLLEAKPDVILMDKALPTVNSYELCSFLRKTPVCQDTPIILMASLEETVDQLGTFALVTEVLAKPFTAEKLLALVGRYAPLRRSLSTKPPLIAPPPVLQPLPASETTAKKETKENQLRWRGSRYTS